MICSVRHLDYQDQTRTQRMDRMDLQLDILVLTGMLVLKIRPCNQNKLEFRRVEFFLSLFSIKKGSLDLPPPSVFGPKRA